MKTWGIIGALCFIASVVISKFCDFPSAELVSIAVAAFGLASVIVSAVKEAKSEKRFNWKTVLVIVFSVVAGALCCIGGLNQNIFMELSAAVLAVLTIIFAIKSE